MAERVLSPITPRLDAFRKMLVVEIARSKDGQAVINFANELLGYYAQNGTDPELLSRLLNEPISREVKVEVEESPTMTMALDGILGLAKGIPLRQQDEELLKSNIEVGCIAIRYSRDAYYTGKSLGTKEE